MKFTPDWILKLTCSFAALNFVMGTLPLRSFANSYARGLRLHYDDSTGEKIEEITQSMLYFLATFESDDHMGYVNSFMFNIIKFEENGQKRKLKSLFKSALEPEKTETSEDEALKHFRKFVFRLRSDQKLAAPKHWKLTDTKDIDALLTIYAQRVRVTDAF